MAKKPTPESIRQRMSSDLIELSQILNKHASDTVINAGVIKSAANGVTRGTKDSWAYEVHGLQLRVEVPQNTIPAGCVGPLIVDFSFELSGNYELDDGVEFVTKLILELVIRSDAGGHICAWHFDRHLNEGEGVPTEAHPLFHFQHGGHAMKPHASDLGRSLLLPAPRLPFPPMDVALAIDFVLSNFSGHSWSKLRAEADYLRLLRGSQDRYWRPYIFRLSEWWGAHGTRPTDKILALWPHLA